MNETIIQSNRQKRRGKRQSAPAKTFLFCTGGQWLIAVLSGLILSGIAWPLYSHISYWIGVTIILMTVTVAHMIFTSRFFIPFPHIAILISGLQYVFGAWLSFYFPADNPIYNIGAQLPEYLSYAGYVIIAFTLGWIVVLWNTRPQSARATSASPALLAELDILFWFGLVTSIASRFVQLGALEFVLILCANLRFVGALGRMMVSGPGWKWRLWLTLILEVLSATRGGMFHSLLLWSACTFALYVFKTQPKRIIIFGLVCLGILLLPALEQAKFKIRENVWSGQEGQFSFFSPKNFKNAANWFGYLGEGVVKTATLDLDSDFLSDIAVRYNQGWIINRVMETVPASQPYAKGRTLIVDITALLPRVLFPNKFVANGKSNMERYANYQLNQTTAMDLGYAGEMYANFGYWGGIIGCFCYALVFGMLFRWVFIRATLNPLWWAFIPYVGLVALKAEGGIGFVWNWMFKAAIVNAAIYFIFPAIRSALSQKTPEIPLAINERSRLRRLREEAAKAYL